jgi:pimeloyl-ACP methyl ester carboxylesterase
MSLETLAPGGMIGPRTLDLHGYPQPDGTSAPEGTIKQADFRSIFAADVPPKTAAIMAASQRPAALASLAEPSGVPAWKTIPSWYLVAGKDNAIGTKVERIMARRIHPRKTIEVKGASHAVLVSQPAKTAHLILDAAKSVH